MDRARLVGCVCSGAIVAAPFLALLYDIAAGLALMMLALTATTYLALEAAQSATGSLRPRLRLLAAANAALAIGCLVALVVRID